MKDPEENDTPANQESNQEDQHPIGKDRGGRSGTGAENESDQTVVSDIGGAAEIYEDQGDDSLASDGPVSQEEGDEGAGLNE